MCQNWLLMDENEIKVSLYILQRQELRALPEIGWYRGLAHSSLSCRWQGLFYGKRGLKMEQAQLPERLETERLVLRVRTVADAVDIFDYASRPEVSYPAGFPPVETLEDEIYYLEHILPERNQKDNLPAGYGIVVKGTDKVIGSVDFNHRHEDDVLEIGYTLHPDYWGRGYVPEAARTLIDLAFKELELHKIELSCFGYNLQSQRVAEKLGFTLEARIRDRKDAQGNRCDSLIYGLLRSEWEGNVVS